MRDDFTLYRYLSLARHKPNISPDTVPTSRFSLNFPYSSEVPSNNKTWQHHLSCVLRVMSLLSRVALVADTNTNNARLNVNWGWHLDVREEIKYPDTFVSGIVCFNGFGSSLECSDDHSAAPNPKEADLMTMILDSFSELKFVLSKPIRYIYIVIRKKVVLWRSCDLETLSWSFSTEDSPHKWSVSGF